MTAPRATQPQAQPDLAVSNADALPRIRTLRRRARLAMRQGRDAFALACLRRVVERGAADAGCFCELATLHQRRGEQAEALDAYLQALRLAPRDVDVHLALGRALVAQDLFGDAVDVCERAVRLDDQRADALVLLADALLGAGADADRHARALAHYERALRIDAGAEQAYCGVARVHLDRGERRDALAVLERGLAVVPIPFAIASLQIELAAALLHRDASASADSTSVAATPVDAAAVDSADVDAASVDSRAAPEATDVVRAVRALRAALNVRPRDVRACRLLIEALERGDANGDGVAAAADVVGACFSLGVALQEAGDLVAAATAFERAIALKPDCLRAWLRLSDVRLTLGQPHEAVRCLEAAVAIDPEHPAAHVNLGWALRMTADFARGCREAAWHYRAGDKRRFEQPVWDGAALGSRTILCWADFALGDTIQDLRFLPLIRAAHPHARMLLECDRRLAPLIERGDARRALADVVITTKAPLPAFDVHVPLRRLSEVLSIDLASLPANVPYLSLPANTTSAAPTKAKSIGFVWAGDQSRVDARIKSASLADFEPLLRELREVSPAARLVSLQLGPTADELIALPPGLQFDRVLADSGDATETALVMQELDLIITVDTMTAHLARALGRPVWVLSAYAPAWWLWHVDGDVDRGAGDAAGAPDSGHDGLRSRWYPTMRIFRQRRAGVWHSVIQDIRVALRALFTRP